MAEYRIVAKVDPQTGAGTQKVKQDLRGIQTEAKATETALNRSFDQAKFDKTIGGLVNRLDQLDGKLAGAGAAAGTASRGIDTATGAMDRMTAAEFRAAGGLDGLNRKVAENTNSNARMEASLRRVLQATDQQALEQLKMNQLLADAKRLLDAGTISQERYAQVQRLAAQAGREQAVVSGSQRIGFQQLGFQLGDMATMYSLGAKPAQIFASQIGQVSQALMLMGGSGGTSMLGRVAGFLGGPWGIALTLGVTLLAPFVAKLWEGNDALKDAVDKKKKDARESEISRQAHERWIGTLDALIERQGRLADAMRDRLKVQGLTDQSDLQQANRDRAKLQEEIGKEQGKLATLRRQLQEASMPIPYTGRGSEAALGQQAATISRINAQIRAAEGEVARLQRAANDAQTRITAGQIIVGEQQGRALVDLTVKSQQWADSYQGALRGILQGNERLRAQTPTITAGFELVRQAIDKAAGAGVNFDQTNVRARQLGVQLRDGRITAAAYRTEMGKLASSLTAAAEAAEKAGRRVSDGVARFTSARQAIGIAGRELQRAGLQVGENEQFGGVRGRHTGAGHREGRAIDVDIAGASDKAPTPPDIRQRYDAMARRYAARGYIVLWAGKRYDPSGRITDIPAGDHQHYGHMHLEAPQAIVGRPTQASGESQVIREEGQQERVQERAEDFIAGVVNQAAQRGLPPNQQAQLNAQIDEALNEFKRRFDREATTDEKATLTKAFTDADARETALRFEQAYVEPLKRLQDLQGKTGVDRAVLNAQLDETARLGRALTPVEAQMIENGIRGNDQLNREAQLLEQVRGPLQEYTNMVAALNALLARKEISQASYNARLAELTAQAASTSFAGLEGVDPATGKNYEDLTAIADENARYAQQLANFETYRTQLLQMGINYDALELAARQQHAENLAAIDRARRDVQLNTMQQAASSVTSILSDAFGKQSRIARAAFVAEKAIAIARAGIALAENVAQAAKIGFPQNIPFIAGALAQGATIMASIRSAGAAVAGGDGYKDGGWTGDGGVNSEAGAVHGQEFVVKAPHARENRALLEAINSGRQVRQVQTGRAAQAAAAGGSAPSPVVVPAPAVNLRMINVTDPRQVEDFFQTPEGEQVFVNMVNRHADTIARAANQSGA